jgi:hypothetical protein
LKGRTANNKVETARTVVGGGGVKPLRQCRYAG